MGVLETIGNYFVSLYCMGFFEVYRGEEIIKSLKEKNRNWSEVVDSIIREVESWFFSQKNLIVTRYQNS